MKLNIEALSVESFEPAAQGPAGAPARGEEGDGTVAVVHWTINLSDRFCSACCPEW